MSLNKSLVREEEEPPDESTVVTDRTAHREMGRLQTIRLSERPIADQTAASTRVQRQFESHCILRLCNAVDDENTVTAVETMRSAVRQTGRTTKP
jgi:hypothetical protein